MGLREKTVGEVEDLDKLASWETTYRNLKQLQEVVPDDTFQLDVGNEIVVD
jgi:hypothetical protein